MKKRIQYLFTFLFLPLFLSSQLATISDGIHYRTDDYFEMIGKIGSNYYLVKDGVEGAELYSFDSYMKMNWSREVKTARKRFDILGSLTQKDHFILVLGYREKGQLTVEVQKYNDAGVLFGSAIAKKYERRNFGPEPYFARSGDRKKFILWEDQEAHKIEAFAYDVEKMELIWDKEQHVGELSLRDDLFQVLVDNKGTLHAMFTIDNTRTKKEESRIALFTLDRNITKTTQIKLQSNLVYDCYFDVDNKNGTIVGGGLYDYRKPTRISGVFYSKIPIKKPEDYTITFHQFPKKIMTNIKGRESEPGDSFNEAYVNEVILRSDGGIMMVIERYKKISQMGGSTDFPRAARPNFGSGNDSEYHYDDIVLASFDNKGATEWFDVLYKRQYSRDDGGDLSSFFIMKTPKQIRFIYNDEIKTNSKVSEYIVLRSGRNERSAILDTEGYNVKLMFRNGMQINKNEIIVPSLKRKDLKLVRIKYG